MPTICTAIQLSPRAQSESLKEAREISRPMTRLDNEEYDQTERKAREIDGLEPTPTVHAFPFGLAAMQPAAVATFDGIFLSDFEQGEIGPDLFRHACLMGLEGLVSKHRDRQYRTGWAACFANNSRFCGTVARALINADSAACLRRVSRWGR